MRYAGGWVFWYVFWWYGSLLIMTYISLELGKAPETVTEAVDRLLVVLSDCQKAEIAAMKEDELIDLHFGLGMEIRKIMGSKIMGSKIMENHGVSQLGLLHDLISSIGNICLPCLTVRIETVLLCTL